DFLRAGVHVPRSSSSWAKLDQADDAFLDLAILAFQILAHDLRQLRTRWYLCPCDLRQRGSGRSSAGKKQEVATTNLHDVPSLDCRIQAGESHGQHAPFPQKPKTGPEFPASASPPSLTRLQPRRS